MTKPLSTTPLPRFLVRINARISTPAIDDSGAAWTTLVELHRLGSPTDYKIRLREHVHRQNKSLWRKWCETRGRWKREMSA